MGRALKYVPIFCKGIIHANSWYQSKVDAILKGDMDASECCSYGKCKGDVVISVGE